MGHNRRLRGIAFHVAPRDAVSSLDAWELVKSLAQASDIEFNRLYLIGDTGKSMSERNFKATRTRVKPPHRSDLTIWLYRASGLETTWWGGERMTGSITLDNVCVNLEIPVAKVFPKDAVVESVRAVSKLYDVTYGYEYEKGFMGYEQGQESTSAWFSDSYAAKPLVKTTYPKDPILRWGWYLWFAAPRIGPRNEGILGDDRPHDLRGVFRDVYPRNVITKEHLSVKLGSLTMQDWINADSSRGTLDPIENALYLWTVPSECINQVRLEMRRHNLLIAYLEYPPPTR
jgi:hypothetical protein